MVQPLKEKLSVSSFPVSEIVAVPADWDPVHPEQIVVRSMPSENERVTESPGSAEDLLVWVAPPLVNLTPVAVGFLTSLVAVAVAVVLLPAASVVTAV